MRYQLDTSKKSSQDMTADIKINVHYFEDGNVQLNNSHNENLRINVTGDAAETAKNVVDAINKFEDEYQSTLEDMYVSMHTTTFKQMRRFLPVHGKPMDWAIVQSLGSEVNQ